MTNAELLTPEVRAGHETWHRNNCINCHTLFGEGAYYAPDLTKIADLRGEAYLKAYMRDPSQFYDETTHRRLMPRQDLEDGEIDSLIAFLEWASDVDTAGWPPRPILVTTGLSTVGSAEAAAPGAASATPVAGGGSLTSVRPVTETDDPRAIGENLFRTATPACMACHSTTPGANLAGPSLAGVGTRAETIVASPEYRGEAADAVGFIRESIRSPSAHLAPGAMYSANGMSFMPDTYATTLTDEQIDALAAYLASLK